MTTIYVQNIPYSASSEDLGKAFEQFGALKRAFILTDRFRGQLQSRGRGFVEFESVDSMNAALAQNGKLTINGRSLNVQVARERRPRVTAFVRGIPKGTTKDIIMQAFAQYNPVDARVVFENTEGEQPRLGFGFVKFNTEDDLKACTSASRTIQLNGAESRISIARRPFDAPPRRGGFRGRRGGRFYRRRGGYRKAPRN